MYLYRGGERMNRRIEMTLRLAGLLVPPYLLVTGLLVRAGIFDGSHYAGDLVFIVLMIAWTLFASYQAIFRVHGPVDALIRMIFFHGLGALYVMFVSGFSMTFIIAWVILMLATNAFFGRVGMWGSAIVLVLLAGLDSWLYAADSSIMMADVMATVAILFVGVAAALMTQIMEVDGVELSRSQAQAMLQRERVITIVNNFTDAVISTDQSGVIKVYNAACLNLLDTNTSLNEQLVSDIIKLYDADDKPVDLLKLLRSTRATVTRDDFVITVSGETLRLEVTLSPIRSSFSKRRGSDTEDGYIVIMRDVTKAKSLEEERDEFISVVSHELRTPITVVEGTLSNVQLMMDRPDISPQVLKDSMNTAHEQVVFLSRMVNDLSTLSRAERGVADEPELIDVRTLAQGLFNEYLSQAEKKKLRFDLDMTGKLGSVKASRLYLKELLQNFITNAIKYTKQGSVTFEVTRHKDKIEFAVRDTGIGISKSDQAKVFNKFYRSEDYRTRETGGTGLGLYVAVKLARKVGTKIELESRLNHGSTFSIELPVADNSGR